jgi:hypothetical protein
VRLTTLSDTLEDLLAILVGLQLGDDDLARGDTNGHGLAVGLLAGDALDLDEVLETVDRGDLALAALVGAPNDGDFVILADGDGSDLEGKLERLPVLTDHKYGVYMCWHGVASFHTLCFSRSSLERGALMILRFWVEPALKWALRDLRLDEARPGYSLAGNQLVSHFGSIP